MSLFNKIKNVFNSSSIDIPDAQTIYFKNGEMYKVLLCDNRLFFFILPYPIQIYPRTVSIHFRLVLCLYSEQIKHFMLYTVNTA